VSPKVIVFGIDGGTLDILAPLARAGHLPVLRRLLEKGASGPLRSTIPPVTAAAWTTFATGTNPGAHGLVDFVAPRAPDYASTVLNASDRRGATLWRLVGESGLSAGVVGVPMTYPPEPHRGYLVTGMMTPSSTAVYTHPAELGPRMEARFGRYPFHPGQEVMPSQTGRYLARMVEDMERSERWALTLLREEPTDLFVHVVAATDPLQHQFLGEISRGIARDDLAAPRGLLAGLLGVYARMDRTLGAILEEVGGDPLVLIMSDHGFGPLEGFFHVNNWLLQRGYLHLSRGPLTRGKTALFRMGLTPENIHLGLLRVGIDLRRRVNKGSSYQRLRRWFLSFDDVDWSRTTAFSVGHVGQIYLNRRSRFRQGTVADGAAAGAILDRLRGDLLSLRRPGTDQPLVESVHLREEIYRGEDLSWAPDLLFLPAGLRWMSFGETAFASSRILGPSLGHTGHHRMEGMLLAAGGGVRPGRVTGAQIADLAPTILHALGLTVPEEMDGRVLPEAFPPGHLEAHPPRRTRRGDKPGATRPGVSAEEEEQMRARLADLGYIS
jgi:predicted AlkP superfamily phosphohydrolase/phosphomutase